jgi:uncharacterized delta-60 repeat protein
MNAPHASDSLSRRWRLAGASALMSAVLAACGGGGDASTSSPPPPPPPPPSFSVALSAPKAVVQQGDDVTVDATVTRSAGFDGAIDLALTGLPAGASAAPVHLASGQTVATITIHADGAAPHSLPTTVSVVGTSGALSAHQDATVTVRGGPGALDTSFATAGVARTAVGPTDDHAEAMVVQPDGKVVVAGWGNGPLGYAFELVRHERDGTLDATFGDGGRVVAAIGHGADEVHAMALQPDGKLLVAGTVDESPKGKSFALARFNADGSLDAGFGTGGQVITSFGSQSDEAFAIALQPDGRIVLGGHTATLTRGIDFALARYLPDGTLDPSFGTGGLVVKPIHALDSRDSVYALALQPFNGELCIVAAGGEGDFTLHRFHADGSDDDGFGVGQRPDAEFGSVIGAARAITIDAQGRLVVAGHVGHDFALLRLNADGLADETFGGSGRVITAVSDTNWDEAQAVTVQADGRVLVAGWRYAGSSSSGDFVLARYTTTGALDAGFGSGGLTLTPVAPNGHDDQGRAIALQPDDRVPTVRALVGGSANATDQDFVVTRYWL